MRHATADTSDDTPHIETDVTLHAIRSVLMDPMLMETSEGSASVPVERPAVRQTVMAGAVRGPERNHSDAGADTPDGCAKDAPMDKETAQRLDMDTIKSALGAYRPTPKHVVLAVFALLLLLRPHWVLLSLALALFLTIGAFVCFGADRMWGMLMVAFQRFSQRRPEQAARLGSKMDAFALRWDALLDRFPEGSVDGLYLPDFQAFSTRDDAHAEAMNARLAQMRSEA
ncbi:hypothetical protein [Ascidiaceihabitans sp.]|uniref:hypothetical protein n=1 Tax=Ascidiaceihabitans sp. TaxID=1872644 RepID=UPI003299C70B